MFNAGNEYKYAPTVFPKRPLEKELFKTEEKRVQENFKLTFWSPSWLSPFSSQPGVQELLKEKDQIRKSNYAELFAKKMYPIDHYQH